MNRQRPSMSWWDGPAFWEGQILMDLIPMTTKPFATEFHIASVAYYSFINIILMLFE